MANLIENPTWEAGIYQLEETDPVQGGAEGVDNLQAKQLANRTTWLNQNKQASDATLTALAALVTAADKLIYATGADTFATTTLSAFIRTLLDDADAATARTTLGAQASDATLTALAAVVTAADKLIYATGVDTFSTATLTAFARTLLDDANAAAALVTLGAAPLASPTFTGVPAAPTAIEGTNTTQLATTAFANAAAAAAAAALVDSSPGVLDTLNEFALALGNDPNFATTITTALAGKQSLDATLTALAAVVTAADKLIYATGADTFSTTTLTAFARTLLDDANAAAALVTLGAASAASVQNSTSILAVAAGTADAITGVFTPAITALTNGLTLFVRAASANATGVPTFKADGMVAKTIVKGSNTSLATGDISGAGHWLELQYDLTLDKWVLQNPATGILTVTATNDVTFADNSVKPASTNWVRGAMSAIATAAGFASLFALNGYVKFPSWLGGFVIQWGQTASVTVDYIDTTFPIAFPTACYAVINVPVGTIQSASISVGAVQLISATTWRFWRWGVANFSVYYIAVGK